MVALAARIEGRPAGGAAVVAGEVVVDAHLGAAGPAEDRRLVPFRLGPHLGRVVGELVVARAAAVVAGEVVVDAHLGAAGPAEDRRLVPFRLGPHLGRVVGELVVALAAGVIDAAAAHLDGDDVQGAVVV